MMIRHIIIVFIFILYNIVFAVTPVDNSTLQQQVSNNSNGDFEVLKSTSPTSFEYISSQENSLANTSPNQTPPPILPIHSPRDITTNSGITIRTNGVYIEETEEEPLASTRNRPRVHRPIGIVNPNNNLTDDEKITLMCRRAPPAPDQDPAVLARIERENARYREETFSLRTSPNYNNYELRPSRINSNNSSNSDTTNELGDLMSNFFNHNLNPANGGQNEVNNEYSNSQTNEHISERTNPTPDEYFQLTTFPALRTTSNGSPASTLAENVRNDTEQTNRDNELLQSTVINNAIDNINNNLTDDEKMEVEVPRSAPTNKVDSAQQTDDDADIILRTSPVIINTTSITNDTTELVCTPIVTVDNKFQNNELVIEEQPKIAQPIVEEKVVINAVSSRPMIKDEVITLPATTNDAQTITGNNSSPVIPEVIVQQQVLPTFSSVDNNIRQMKNKFPELVSELFSSSIFDLDGYYTLGIFSSYKYKDFKANTYGSLISVGNKYDKYAYSIGIGLIRSDLRYHELKRSADTSIMSTRLQYFIDDNNTLNLVPSIAITRFNKKYMYNYNIKTYIDSKLNFKNFNLDLILGADAKFLAYHKDNADAMTKIRLYKEYTRGNLKFEPSITFGIYSPRNILYLNHRLKFDINDSFCAIDFELFSKKKNYHFVVSSKLAIWF